jgi:hypothetical protein
MQPAIVPVADDPTHWQKRELAETMSDISSREALLKLAADYDKLAQRAANRQAPKSLGPAGWCSKKRPN